MWLWCDECSEKSKSENQRKCKREGSPSPTSKRAEKGIELHDLVAKLMGLQGDKHNLSDPQYRLWVRMIITGQRRLDMT